jgi:hypothetical protein
MIYDQVVKVGNIGCLHCGEWLQFFLSMDRPGFLTEDISLYHNQRVPS